MAKKYRQPNWEEANLSEGILFQLLMQNRKVCLEFLQRTIKDRKVVAIDKITLEKVLGIHYAYHGARLDIHVSDVDGVQFDIELQVINHKNIWQRIVFYHSQMVVSALERGEDYSKLTPTYVIFICLFDPVGLNWPVYRYGMVNLDHREDMMPFSPMSIIYNTKGDLNLLGEHSVKGLLQMINDDVPEVDDFVKLVQKEVSELKGNTEARKIYMDRWQETLEEAIKIEVAEQLKEKVAEQLEEKVAEQLEEKVAERVEETRNEITNDGVRNLITSLVTQGQNPDSILSLVMSVFKLNHQQAEEAYHKYGPKPLA